jgi:acyl-CoA reductase-like NAD-dependent aldehyde dehydrogenase
VLRTAAENLTYATLELGGKNALMVLDDADLQTAVDVSIEGMFYNQGEACTSTSRILVHRSRYDEFVERFIAAAAKLTVGDGLDAATDIGAMVDAKQQQKVLGYVDTAVAEGRRSPSRARRRRIRGCATGFWVPPTVLAGVEPHHTVAQEEIFGRSPRCWCSTPTTRPWPSPTAPATA